MARVRPGPDSPHIVAGGARWCEQHGRGECVRNRSRGRGICHGTAIRGTDACKQHSGVSTSVAKFRGEANLQAWKAQDEGATIDYRMAVLGVLQMTWVRMGLYAELLRQQVVTEGETTSGEDVGEFASDVNKSGLIGHKYGAAGKDGHIYAQNEEVRALVALEASERDRVVRYAKTAHDMGISDRLTALAERWGDIVATKMTLILEGLDLTPEQAIKVPGLITHHLGTIDVSSIQNGP
jgi:hypothetical protein